MFSLSIMLDSGQWRLLFKAEETLDKAWQQVTSADGDWQNIQDDFGQLVFLKRSAIRGALREDLNQSKLAAVELTLHDARIRAKATQAAQTDPAIREASRVPGPSVLTPMGAGPRFQA